MPKQHAKSIAAGVGLSLAAEALDSTSFASSSPPRRLRRRLSRLSDYSDSLLVLGLLMAFSGTQVSAHDIPTDVTIQALLRPQGHRLHLLVRVPLEAMQDTIIPTSGPGYIDFESLRDSNILQDAATLWISQNISLYEGRERLQAPKIGAIRVSIPSDRSFASYEAALAQLQGPPLPATTRLIWRQGLLDVLFEYAIESEESSFSILPTHARLGLQVLTVLRFMPPGGAVRAFEYRGDPGLIRLDPRWHQAAWRFVQSGFLHILDGIDHLLFLVCLVIPLRRFRELVWVVTSFTVAHSTTLVAAAYGFVPDGLWFPPLVEVLIAASIVYMAFENIAGAKVERRWLIAFAFGLVHGFGFSFALSETLQFAGSHLLTSLLSFNVGVELGQLLVLIVMVPVLDALFRFVVKERIGTILLSALVAHTSWHWLSDRAGILAQYQLDWPVVGVVPASAIAWALLVLIVGVLVARGYLEQPGRRKLGQRSVGG